MTGECRLNSGNGTRDRDKLDAHNLHHQRQKVAPGTHLEEALQKRGDLCVGKSHAKSANGRSQCSECAAMSEMQEPRDQLNLEGAARL